MDIPKQPDATAHGKPEYASKELCCRFRFATAFSGKFGCNNHSRNAGASERLAAVSYDERWSGKPNHQCIQV